MTTQDMAQIMDILTAFYPSFYAKQTDDARYLTAKLWANIFDAYPVEVVAAGVKMYVASDEKGYPPVPGQIISKLQTFIRQDDMTEMQAWSIVRKALSNCAYYSEREFNKMPPLIQRVCGSPQQLKDWALMDLDELNSVIASNFQRSYRALAEAERERSALPKDIQNMIQEYKANLLLENTEKE